MGAMNIAGKIFNGLGKNNNRPDNSYTGRLLEKAVDLLSQPALIAIALLGIYVVIKGALFSSNEPIRNKRPNKF